MSRTAVMLLTLTLCVDTSQALFADGDSRLFREEAFLKRTPNRALRVKFNFINPQGRFDVFRATVQIYGKGDASGGQFQYVKHPRYPSIPDEGLTFHGRSVAESAGSRIERISFVGCTGNRAISMVGYLSTSDMKLRVFFVRSPVEASASDPDSDDCNEYPDDDTLEESGYYSDEAPDYPDDYQP